VKPGSPDGSTREVSSGWIESGCSRLAFTRYSFTSRLLCTNQPSFHSPRPPALSTLVQYYCTIIGQYSTPLPTSRVHTIYHIISVITISCKGQAVGRTHVGRRVILSVKQSTGHTHTTHTTKTKTTQKNSKTLTHTQDTHTQRRTTTA